MINTMHIIPRSRLASKAGLRGVFLLVLTSFLTPACLQALIPAAEREALEVLYASTGGPGWSRSEGWLGPVGSECAGPGWFGVRCDQEGSHVIGLELSENGLKGSLPAQLGNLTSLATLNLPGNQLSGVLPETLGNLTLLQELSLGANRFSGQIPGSFANLRRLRALSLENNSLSGPVPLGLASLPALELLHLHRNHLSGTLPVIWLSSELKSLDLSSNSLEGPLPENLGSLFGLRELRLAGNRFRGAVPRSLLRLSQTVVIDLRWNALDAENADLLSLLDSRSPDFDFPGTQTLPPTQVMALAKQPGNTWITWQPSAYIANEGGYYILSAKSPNDPLSLDGPISSKHANTFVSIGTSAYDFFALQSFTLPHAGNQNQVISDLSPLVNVPPPPPEPGFVDFYHGFSSLFDVAEGENVLVPVHRYDGNDGNVSVLARTENGSAGPDDFAPATQLLQWGNWDDSLKGFVVPIIADDEVEETETFHVTLEQPQGGVRIADNGRTVVRIVDRDVSGSGENPVAARDPEGTILFVWVGAEEDGSTGIFGRFADRDGRPSGNSFQISEPSPGIDEENPGVVALQRDRFRIIWEHQRGAVRRDVTRIRGGVKFDTQILLNTHINPGTLKIAADESGKSTVLIWRSGERLLGRFLRMDGSTIKALRLDGQASGKPDFPDLAFEPTTRTLLVVWEQKRPDGDSDIFRRFFSTQGSPLGPEALVHSSRVGLQTRPKVAGIDSGFLVAWQSTPVGPSPDPAGTELRAARIAPSIPRSRAGFRVNSHPVGSQSDLAIMVDENGDCILAWLRDGSERDGLFFRTLPDCSNTGSPERAVDIFDNRAVLTPFLFPALGSVGVVYQIGDTVRGDGGISVESLPIED
jgi:hypothetical protein